MEVSLHNTAWHQEEALALENEALRSVVVPKMGGKLVSLFDKRNQIEWLVGPDQRSFRPVPYGASFVDQDMSGWDEMFPTIVACSYPGPGENQGVELPDHGEVWTLPWSVEGNPTDHISLAVEGQALPYRLSRRMGFSATDTIEFYYQLINTGRVPLPYIWASHPQFSCGQGVEIELPPQVRQVCNTLPEEWGWSKPETVYDWPDALDPSGERVRLDQVGPADLKQARKFFIPPTVQIDRVRLIRKDSRDWLRMIWSPEDVPYFGIWIDEGALSHASVVTPEPMTGYYDSLETAWKKNRVSIAEPGNVYSWRMTVQLGVEEGPQI